jgi:hypothetical protein
MMSAFGRLQPVEGATCAGQLEFKRVAKSDANRWSGKVQFSTTQTWRWKE